MLKNKKKLFIVFISILVITTISFSIFALNQNSIYKIAGKLSKEIKANNGNVIVIVDGEEITDKNIQLSKQVNSNFSEKQIVDDLVADQLLLKEAQQKGFTVTDTEIDKCIVEAKEAMKNDSNNADSFKNYIDGLGLTENQYWQDARKSYSKIIIIEKLRAFIKEQYIKDNNLNPQAEDTQQKFMDYYKNYIHDLVNMNRSKIIYKNAIN